MKKETRERIAHEVLSERAKKRKYPKNYFKRLAKKRWKKYENKNNS
jgi:hypothetical protein